MFVYPFFSYKGLSPYSATSTGTATGQQQYGNAVTYSADGSTLAIAAPMDSTYISWGGAIYIYTADGTGWTLQAKLFDGEPQAQGMLGSAVALSADGNTLAVGQTQRNSASGNQSGAVYIFTRSGSTWTKQTKLIASDAKFALYFGVAVALSGDGNALLVGALGATTTSGIPGGVLGGVYPFTRSGSTWTAGAKVIESGSNPDNRFAMRIVCNSDASLFMVNSPNRTVAGVTNAGAIHVYSRSGTTCTLRNTITRPTPVVSESFGSNIETTSDGNTWIVGVAAAGSTRNATIYSRTDTATWTWTPQATLTKAGTIAADLFGCSGLAISPDGTLAIVGAYGTAPGGTETYYGAAYLYRWDGSAWDAGTAFPYPYTSGQKNSSFGQFAAIHPQETQAVIAAPIHNNYTGDVFFYNL